MKLKKQPEPADSRDLRGSLYEALSGLFRPDPSKQEAERLYAQIVAVARTPAFYRRFAVPDTADGRLDSVMLHLCLVLFYYQERNRKLTRCLTECFVRDMDRNLREMGISDVRLGRWVRKTAYALNGRFIHYQEALKQPPGSTTGSTKSLAEALQRNLYRSLPPTDTSTDTSPSESRTNKDNGSASSVQSSPTVPTAPATHSTGADAGLPPAGLPPPGVLEELCNYVRAQYAHTQQNHGNLHLEWLDSEMFLRPSGPKTEE